jgi:hypothetical protein
MRRLGGAALRNQQKTHCPTGHAYTNENTYVSPQGRRHCLKCRRRRDQLRGWER